MSILFFCFSHCIGSQELFVELKYGYKYVHVHVCLYFCICIIMDEGNFLEEYTYTWEDFKIYFSKMHIP